METKVKRKYTRKISLGESSHDKWVRIHTEKWNNQIAEAEEIIAEYDCMSHEQLFESLKNGAMALHHAFKMKSKAEALIAKYHTQPTKAESEIVYAQ